MAQCSFYINHIINESLTRSRHDTNTQTMHAERCEKHVFKECWTVEHLAINTWSAYATYRLFSRENVHASKYENYIVKYSIQRLWWHCIQSKTFRFRKRSYTSVLPPNQVPVHINQTELWRTYKLCAQYEGKDREKQRLKRQEMFCKNDDRPWNETNYLDESLRHTKRMEEMAKHFLKRRKLYKELFTFTRNCSHFFHLIILYNNTINKDKW